MNKSISLNKILVIINILLIIVSCYLFNNYGVNKYINIWTIILNIFLNLEIIFFLRIAEKKKNSLIFILSFLLTIFYSLRVLTLTFNPFSYPFLRYNISHVDINYTLIFIIIGSFFMFLGINLSKKHTDLNHFPLFDKYDILFKPKNAIIVLFASILLMFLNTSQSSLSVIKGYLSTLFINPMYLLLAVFVFFIYYNIKIKNRLKIIFYILLIIFILTQLLNGSRSALLSGLLIFMFSFLSYKGIIYIKLKYFFFILALVPLSIVFFVMSTYIRQNDARNSSLNEKVELIKLFNKTDGIENMLALVFDRIGFLDYATEMISQRESYSSVINPPYYFKSIIDNVFSPGFNVFDTPKISNSLIFIYDKRGTPSLNAMNENNYQSDQLTIFGEFYILFGGWFSIIILFFCGYIFQVATITSSPHELTYLIKNAFIYNSFYILINSFGLDWFIFDILSFILTYLLFLFILKITIKIQ